MEKISYAKTVYGKDEIEAVVRCLNNSTQMGQNARAFEKKIAELFSKRFCLYLNSGSSALFVGLESFNFPEGSEVITPALTFSTTVGSIVKNKLIPTFVDVDINTYCIQSYQIEEMINNKTVAILAPNLLGNLPNWSHIKDIADRYKLKVIEDSADTLGAQFQGQSSGTYSDMSITSFYGSHIINCAGNGGALCFNDLEITKKAKLLRSWGRSSSLFDDQSESIENRFNVQLDGIDYDAKFLFEEIGYNLEGSEIGAAFGLVQLQKLKKNILIRQRNFLRQITYFSQYCDFFNVPSQLDGVETAWLAFPILIKKSAPFSRKDFQIFLEERNIQTRVVFTGNITKQPMSKKFIYKSIGNGLTNSDNIMARGVLLPLHHGMTDSMFDRLFSVIDEFIRKNIN